MIRIGLTGSIGMGKTTTAKLFAEAGIPVFDADSEVHQLYEKGGEAVIPLQQVFPMAVMNQTIDRVALAKHLALNPNDYALLEKIVHPLVAERRKNWIQQQQDKAAKIVLFDIPLLFEGKKQNTVDFVVVVTAPKELQKQRVMPRNGMNEQKFQQILNRQMPDEEKQKRAHYIIETSGGINNARLQVRAVLRHIDKTTNK